MHPLHSPRHSKLHRKKPSTLEYFSDGDDRVWGRSIKTGEVLHIISFGMYVVEDGKFKHIQSARYKMISDWKME